MSTVKQVQRRGASLLVIAAIVTIVASALYAQHLLFGSGEAAGEATPQRFVPVSAEQGSPHDIGELVAVFSLPEDLREVSALTVLDDRHLGAVQDEEGALYVLDQETGEVTAVMPFGPPGDYEGVELAGDRLFVLRSDGALFEVEGWAGGEDRTRSYPTGLGTDCDAEGLGFDAAEDRLLIACKEDGDERRGGEGLGARRAVYAFDLATMELGSDPVFLLDPEAVAAGMSMKPSGLAVHPTTGQVYVMSSVGMALVALSPDGSIANTWSLESAGFEQPEGIAFARNGDLFIASEGVDREPVLKRFAFGQ